MADVGHELLKVQDLTVRLGGRNVISDVDLSMRSGELTGLIGSNGAGKTTLLRAILGLVRPTSGRVTIEGRPRLGRDRSVGYVPQSVALDPDVPLRARDLVALGVDGHRFGIPLPSKSRRRIVDEALETVGASGFGGQAVGTLSGGQRQRVLIAHALAGSPRLLLMDEPLANLDPRAEGQVVDVLDHVAHSCGIGVLISTHDMNPLLHAMDRVAYITAGRLASGPTHEVLSTDSLSRLYGHHVDVIRVHDRLIVVPGASEKAFEHREREPVTSVI